MRCLVLYQGMKMIANTVRMKKRKMFLHVANKGMKVVCPSMVVQVCPNELDIVRIGFTVTKKVGCAVVRNRIRRRLRELVRVSGEIKEFIGWDFVFIGRLATKDKPYPVLEADLREVLAQVKQSYQKDKI